VISHAAMDNLVTARLELHPISVNDAKRVLAGDPDGARWAPGYPTQGDVFAARRFIETCANTGDPRPFGNYEIRRREDGHAIGGVGFHAAPDENGKVTIGYGLVPTAQGNGYASEALRGLIEFARTQGVTSVEGDTAHENTASQHVMTAVGMLLIAQDEQLKYYRITWDDTL
jgi:RimJ/RimL family protein N-acetyltransferase